MPEIQGDMTITEIDSDLSEKRCERVNPDKISFVRIDRSRCRKCLSCSRVCPTGAIPVPGNLRDHIPDPDLCINCAQCIIACPYHAIGETVSDLDKLEKHLADPSVYTVAIMAPSTPAGFAVAYGIRDTEAFRERIVGSLRTIGFDHVWNNTHGADLAIIEEAGRFSSAGDTHSVPATVFTSSCPGWIKFARTMHPELVPHISRTKPPISILGARAKNGSIRTGNSGRIVTVAIMPCVAKKYERMLPENTSHGVPDIDITVTTREIIGLLQKRGIDPVTHPRSSFDGIPGIDTKSISYFKSAGSVAGGIIRHLSVRKFTEHSRTRIDGACTVTTIRADGPAPEEIRIAEINGVENVRPACTRFSRDSSAPDIIEVMACHGGCRYGGGQPVTHSFLTRCFARVRQWIRPYTHPVQPRLDREAISCCTSDTPGHTNDKSA